MAGVGLPIGKSTPANKFADLGINRIMGIIIGVLTLTVTILIIFPQTFFAANIINDSMILLIMVLALKPEI